LSKFFASFLSRKEVEVGAALVLILAFNKYGAPPNIL
jgi:hypothetical protein